MKIASRRDHRPLDRRTRPTPRTCPPCGAPSTAGDVARRRVRHDVQRPSRSGRSASVVISTPAGASTAAPRASARRAPPRASARTPTKPRRCSHAIASGRASQAGTCSATFPIAAAWLDMRRYSSPPMPRRRIVRRRRSRPTRRRSRARRRRCGPPSRSRPAARRPHGQPPLAPGIRPLAVLELVGGVRPLRRELRRQRRELHQLLARRDDLDAPVGHQPSSAAAISATATVRAAAAEPRIAIHPRAHRRAVVEQHQLPAPGRPDRARPRPRPAR